MELYVGIDWAQSEHAVCLMGAKKKIVSEFAIEHSEDGFVKLLRKIEKHASKAETTIGIETRRSKHIPWLDVRTHAQRPLDEEDLQTAAK